MRDLIIGKDIAYALSTATGTIAGVWAINLLTDGSIAVVDNAGTLIAANVSAIASSVEYITFLTKTSTTPKVGFPIYNVGFNLTSYSKQVYVAPVKGKKFLGNDDVNAYTLNLPATISVGQTVGVGIADFSKPFEDIRRYKEYTFSVVSGDLLTGVTAKNIIVKLVAQINADAYCPIVATLVDDSTNATGIQFEAKTAGVDFQIYNMDGVLKDADIVEYELVNGVKTAGSTTATLSVEGQGTVAELTELLKATKSRDGDNSYLLMGDLLYSGGNQLVAASQYVVYTITTTVPNSDVISAGVKPPMTLVIATTNSATVTGIDNILVKLAAA